MKILVLSDSHAGLSFMRMCVRAVRPDAMIHLGDFFEDGEALSQDFPHIPMHQVPGNCDQYRMVRFHPETLCYDICGVHLYITHGHRERVKSSLFALVKNANAACAQAALYGHTHLADCHQEENGLWVLNPGSCASSGGSAGLIETENGKITACKILTRIELEEML